MRNDISNAEVDRILQEVHGKKTPEQVSNALVDEVLQSIQRAQTPTVSGVVEPQRQAKAAAAPQKPARKAPSARPAQAAVKKPQPVREETSVPQDSTQEFQFNIRVEHEPLPPTGKNLVVDERFRDFFTQTAIEIEPQPLLGGKKEKKPTLRERLNQAKERNAAKNTPQYSESDVNEDAGFAIEEQREQQANKSEQDTIEMVLPEKEEKKQSKAVVEHRFFEETQQIESDNTGEFSFHIDQPLWDTPAQEQKEEAEPVQEEEEEAAEEQPEEKPRKWFFPGGLRLFGTPKDEEEEFEEDEPEQDESEEVEEPTQEIEQPQPEQEDEPEEKQDDGIEEYDDPSQAQRVQDALFAVTARSTVRAVVTGLIAVLLLWLGMGAARLFPLPGLIDPAIEKQPLLLVNLILCAVAAIICIGTIKDGLAGLFGKPSTDTMPALAILAAFVQSVFLLSQNQYYEQVTFTLFSGIAVLSLSLNALGKRVPGSVVGKNFEMASSQLEHWAACTITDRERVSLVAKGLDEPEPCLVVSRPTALVKDFLKQSFSVRASERNAQKLSYLVLAVAVVCAAVGGFMAKSVAVGISVFTGTICFACPFASTLMPAVPSMLMQKQAGKMGAVVPGWSAIEQLGKTNMVLVGAKDLFPAGSVTLKGIKTFEKERIDLAILYATSILVEGCDTMREVFSGIVQGKTDILYPVESFTLEVGCGYCAWINNERVLIGTREMMLRHGLEVPSQEWENRACKNGQQQLLYLAVSGKLFGVFGLEYTPDPSVEQVIQSLYQRGISLLVKSDDCCVSERLISTVYQLPIESVKVLNEKERKTLGPELIFRPESEGVMTHLGSFASFVGGLRAAENAAAGEKLATMVQTAAVVFSCLIALGLTASGGLISLALPAVLLYQAAWTVLQLAMPLSKQ